MSPSCPRTAVASPVAAPGALAPRRRPRHLPAGRARIAAKGWVRSLSSGPPAAGVGRRRRRLRGLRRARGSRSPVGAAAVRPTGSFDVDVRRPGGRQHRHGVGEPRRGHPHREPAPAADRRVPASGLRGDDRPPGRGRTGAPTRSPSRSTPTTTPAGRSATPPVTWQVTDERGDVPPPGWDDFDFGRWTPWWSSTDDVVPGRPYGAEPCCGPSRPSQGGDVQRRDRRRRRRTRSTCASAPRRRPRRPAGHGAAPTPPSRTSTARRSPARPIC